MGGDEPGSAKRAKRVLRQVAFRNQSQACGSEIPHASERIGPRTGREGDRHRVDREIPPPEIFVDRLSLELCDVDLALPRDARHAGCGFRKQNACSESRVLEIESDRKWISRGRRVDVDHVAAEEEVACGSSDDPGRSAAR